MPLIPGFVAVPHYYAVRRLRFSKGYRQWDWLNRRRMTNTKKLYFCTERNDSSDDKKESEMSNLRLVFLRFLVGLLSSSVRVSPDLKDAFEREFEADSDFSMIRYVCWRLRYQLDLLGYVK